MGNFSGGFWNLFIFVVTLGGIVWLFWLIGRYTSKQRTAGQVETMGHKWDDDLEELNNPLPRWWLNLFYITLVFGIGYLIFYPGLGSNDMFLGWTQVKQYDEEMAAAEERYGPIFEQFMGQDVATLSTHPEALRIGRRLYANYCSTCHGSDARGGPGFPNLRDGAWLWGGDPQAIEASILNGRQAAMPPWGEALGEEAVRQVTQYVLGLNGREVDESVAAAGEALFAANCSVCHGADAKGNTQLGAPNLTDGIWLYGGSALTVERSIAEGRGGRMPAQREFLGEAKAHLLAAYVLSLSE